MKTLLVVWDRHVLASHDCTGVFVLFKNSRNVSHDKCVLESYKHDCRAWVYPAWFSTGNISHTPWLWDLFLACSPRCVTARACMSAVKCDLRWPWPPLSQLGQHVPNVGLTGGTALRTGTHTGATIMKKDLLVSWLTLSFTQALWYQDPGTLLIMKSSW